MQKKKFIRAGYLIDGSGAAVQESCLLAVENGLISAVLPAGEEEGVPAEQVVDLSHCTILPPLVDSHLHLFMSGTTDRVVRDRQLVDGYDALAPVIGRHVQDLFNHGVLAFRDGGDRSGASTRYMHEVGHPGVVGRMSGRAFHDQGRYGKLIGRSPREKESLAEAYQRRQEDIDQVKLVNSGLNSLKIFGKQTKPQFSRDEIRALVATADRDGRPVMVHANGVEPVREAILAGCRSIEHGFFMGDENLRLMVERGTFWVPTLFTMKAYGMFADPAEHLVDRGVVARNLESQLQQLALARELGVNVALGTDAGSLGVLHGESVVEEMKLYAQAGYSLPEIIHCCARVGAELLGLPESGLLAAGRPATFLVVRGTPAQLPRKLTYLEAIYLRGEASELYRKNPEKHVPGRDK